MGFLEKLKNTFFEEEYVEIDEKPKALKEPKREIPKIEPKKKEEKVKAKPVKDEVKEEKPIEVLEEVAKPVVQKRIKEEKVVEKPAPKKANFNYFDDEDFLGFTDDDYDAKPSTQNENTNNDKPKLYDNPAYASKQPTTNAAKSTPYPKQVKSGFQPTPIISPIYGILDKNYTKEEIADKKEVKPSSYVSRKNADLDSVREKAFGSSLTTDFNLTDSKKEEAVPVVIEDNFDDFDEIEDNLLYDMAEDSKTPAVDKVTLQDAEEYFQDLGLEYNIDYKDAKLEHATGRRVAKTPKIDEIDEEDDIVSEDIEEIAVIEEENKDFDENGSLEDNLFDLIDSMYEEKE